MPLLWYLDLPSSGFYSNTFVPNNQFWWMILVNLALRCLGRCLKILLVVSLFCFRLLFILLLFFFFLFFFLFQFYIYSILKDVWISAFLFGIKQAAFIKFYIDAFHYLIKSEVVTFICFAIPWVPNKYAFIHLGVKFSDFVVFPFYVTLASKNYEVLEICRSWTSFP